MFKREIYFSLRSSYLKIRFLFHIALISTSNNVIISNTSINTVATLL